MKNVWDVDQEHGVRTPLPDLVYYSIEERKQNSPLCPLGPVIKRKIFSVDKNCMKVHVSSLLLFKGSLTYCVVLLFVLIVMS